VLRGERTLSLRAEPPRRGERERGNTGGAASTALSDLPAEAIARFEVLRAWRAEAARAQNVPAYVIFHDSTLRAIALSPPVDADALATINGVGASKLERYGEAVLEALARAA
jgi:ATP-dependent DNA helicase RecQ